MEKNLNHYFKIYFAVALNDNSFFRSRLLGDHFFEAAWSFLVMLRKKIEVWKVFSTELLRGRPYIRMKTEYKMKKQLKKTKFLQTFVLFGWFEYTTMHLIKGLKRERNQGDEGKQEKNF